MANKDHSLDKKIVDSAMTEFMTYGYRGASIHRIAANAGVTTGAIYTRYESKDALFGSLVEDLFQDVITNILPLSQAYADLSANSGAEAFLSTYSEEMDATFAALFRHYDQCRLLLCKSEGSSAAQRLQKALQIKAESTVAFMERVATHPLNTDAIHMLILSHLNMYRDIIEQGYEQERAEACLKTLDHYLKPVWKAIFADATQDATSAGMLEAN